MASNSQAVRATDVLILRKTPYAETSLVVAGVAPDVGQVHFMVRGGRRMSRTRFPMVDLYRTLRVSYREGRSDLHTWQDVELVEDFSGVASNRSAFEAAGWLARFALLNVMQDTENPRFYRALLTALGRLSRMGTAPPGGPDPTGVARAAVVGAGIVFLEENGLLPVDPADATQVAHFRELSAMGEGLAAGPRLAPSAWEELARWLEAVLRHVECRLPESIP